MSIESITEEEQDDSPWLEGEMAMLAGIAFGELDDTDYSEYLRDNP